MEYIVSILIGYLLGSSCMAFYISKIKNVDIKGQGTRNYGASNTVYLLGLKAGFIVFLHDFTKAVLAVLIASWIFPDAPYVGVVAGCASVVGHIYPFYLKFDGGKGFASFIGMSVALYPLFGLMALLLAAGFAFAVDYVVEGTFSFILIIPIFALFKGQYIGAAIMFATTLLIFYKHKENITNLVTKNGKEIRIREALSKK